MRHIFLSISIIGWLSVQTTAQTIEVIALKATKGATTINVAKAGKAVEPFLLFGCNDKELRGAAYDAYPTRSLNDERGERNKRRRNSIVASGGKRKNNNRRRRPATRGREMQQVEVIAVVGTGKSVKVEVVKVAKAAKAKSSKAKCKKTKAAKSVKPTGITITEVVIEATEDYHDYDKATVIAPWTEPVILDQDEIDKIFSENGFDPSDPDPGSDKENGDGSGSGSGVNGAQKGGSEETIQSSQMGAVGISLLTIGLIALAAIFLMFVVHRAGTSSESYEEFDEDGANDLDFDKRTEISAASSTVPKRAYVIGEEGSVYTSATHDTRFLHVPGESGNGNDNANQIDVHHCTSAMCPICQGKETVFINALEDESVEPEGYELKYDNDGEVIGRKRSGDASTPTFDNPAEIERPYVVDNTIDF